MRFMLHSVKCDSYLPLKALAKQCWNEHNQFLFLSVDILCLFLTIQGKCILIQTRDVSRCDIVLSPNWLKFRKHFKFKLKTKFLQSTSGIGFQEEGHKTGNTIFFQIILNFLFRRFLISVLLLSKNCLSFKKTRFFAAYAAFATRRRWWPSDKLRS